MPGFDELANAWISGLLTYEPGRPIEEVARELGFAGAEEIVKLASNENAMGPSPKAVDAMTAAAGAMHRYPDGGCFYLKRALADKLGVEPEQILPGNGSNELIELLGHVFLSPENSIVMGSQAFVVYRLVAMAARAETVAVAMPEFTHDLPSMLEAIDEKTRIVFISNPNNPTGTIVDQAAIDAFMREVPDSVVVCFDEAYIELLPASRQPDVLKYVREGRNVVVLRTFSKVYGLAGLRIGYAVAPSACIALLHKVRQPFNVNAMAQAAALAALADDDHVRKTREMVADGLAFIGSELDKLGIAYVPSVTNFMLARLGKGRQAFEALQREGVIVRPMDGYGLLEHVRITVGLPEENRKLIEALGRVEL